MPKVKISHNNRICEAKVGESVLGVLQREGFDIDAYCGGFGYCGKCIIKVLSGNVSKPTAQEIKHLKERIPQGFRLACQALIVEDVEIDIKESDLRIDTYRATGAGGQHVNTTDSAVRITHLPTNIVVQCQNERSQYSNKMTAMKILRARLFEYYQREKEEDLKKISGKKKEIAWGSQIRSYVFHPYQMVKDHRTDVESGNLQAIMDGEIDCFIESYLKSKRKY